MRIPWTDLNRISYGFHSGFGFPDFICGFGDRISSHYNGGIPYHRVMEGEGGKEHVPMSYKLNLQPSWSQLSKWAHSTKHLLTSVYVHDLGARPIMTYFYFLVLKKNHAFYKGQGSCLQKAKLKFSNFEFTCAINHYFIITCSTY